MENFGWILLGNHYIQNVYSRFTLYIVILLEGLSWGKYLKNWIGQKLFTRVLSTWALSYMVVKLKFIICQYAISTYHHLSLGLFVLDTMFTIYMSVTCLIMYCVLCVLYRLLVLYQWYVSNIYRGGSRGGGGAPGARPL